MPAPPHRSAAGIRGLPTASQSSVAFCIARPLPVAPASPRAGQYGGGGSGGWKGPRSLIPVRPCSPRSASTSGLHLGPDSPFLPPRVPLPLLPIRLRPFVLLCVVEVPPPLLSSDEGRRYQGEADLDLDEDDLHSAQAEREEVRLL